MPIPNRIVPSVVPSDQSPARIAREFRERLSAGARLAPVGEAKRRPSLLLEEGHVPKFRLDLFDATFYLTRLRQNPDLRFFVAYVILGSRPDAGTVIHPRLFYKDVSLVWRSPSHLAGPVDDYWVGKGDVEVEDVDGYEVTTSREETTDLPLELQAALDGLSRRYARVPYEERAVRLVLRRAPGDRVRPYADFLGPRRRAEAEPENRIHGGRSVARFRRANDPSSLTFVRGFEPDFDDGVLEETSSRSVLYGGRLRRFRIVSTNRRAQYLFFAAPRQVWIIPPQSLTTELSTFGLRTVDVRVDEDLCVPGFEYHFLDESEDPPVFVSQIPSGFAGRASRQDPSRADASRWLDALPVVREFRRKVLRRRDRRSPPGRGTRSGRSRRVPE